MSEIYSNSCVSKDEDQNSDLPDSTDDGNEEHNCEDVYGFGRKGGEKG